MCALKPPFRAEDMQGLYKKVVRGQYPRVPNVYSADLAQCVKLLLQVSPNMRPDADKLLKSPLLAKYNIDKLIPILDDEQNELLNTIKIPKNLHLLTDILPKPTYSDSFITKKEKVMKVKELITNEDLHERESNFLPTITSESKLKSIGNDSRKRLIIRNKNENE